MLYLLSQIINHLERGGLVGGVLFAYKSLSYVGVIAEWSLLYPLRLFK